jgi:hypothetical protein
MTRKEFVDQKIEILKSTMKSYNTWSIVLFVVSVVFLTVVLMGAVPKIESDMVKFSFSGVTTLSGFALQGFKYTRKSKLLELNYCSGLVDKYESLSDFDKKIIDKALDGSK